MINQVARNTIFLGKVKCNNKPIKLCQWIIQKPIRNFIVDQIVETGLVIDSKGLVVEGGELKSE